MISWIRDLFAMVAEYRRAKEYRPAKAFLEWKDGHITHVSLDRVTGWLTLPDVVCKVMDENEPPQMPKLVHFKLRFSTDRFALYKESP